MLSGGHRSWRLRLTSILYPYYGSDGSAARAAGNDFRVGLIGPGVASSHSTERTHKEGVEATIDHCEAYVRESEGLEVWEF